MLPQKGNQAGGFFFEEPGVNCRWSAARALPARSAIRQRREPSGDDELRRALLPDSLPAHVSRAVASTERKSFRDTRRAGRPSERKTCHIGAPVRETPVRETA